MLLVMELSCYDISEVLRKLVNDIKVLKALDALAEFRQIL